MVFVVIYQAFSPWTVTSVMISSSKQTVVITAGHLLAFSWLSVLCVAILFKQ